MQHTDKYKFNLIETSDTFSSEALNENARAVEAQLTAVRDEMAAGKAELQAADAAIRADLGIHGKTARIATGICEDVPGTTGSVTVDFYPLVVFVKAEGKHGHVLIRPDAYTVSMDLTLYNVTWTDRSVSWNPHDYNNKYSFFYVALGVEDD